ncbi:MAG: DNA polymerase III subunit gamma/tau [Schleiferiaceae bacterium]|nr:DNA polymerase III subunit gamma/tau [Schleiferiaceae bacterium]
MEQFVVSARKYRPQAFEAVVGQSHITDTLLKSVDNDHLAQALLFCGPRGVGKTTCARILAKVINGGANLNDEELALNIFELDAASNNSVDDIRRLIDQVRFAPQTGKFKVYIIDEVHMLSQQAFNAFLKTLEEPPAHAIFILATTEKHKIIPTILSRCQIFDFKRITVDDIAGHLAFVAEKEGVNAEPEALHMIAEKADGALRDALSLFDRMVSFSGNALTYEQVVNVLDILDYNYFFRTVNLANEVNYPDLLLLYNEVLEKGFNGHEFVVGMAKHFRDLLVAREPRTVELLEVGPSIREQYLSQSKASSTRFLLHGLKVFNELDGHYKMASQPRILVELGLLKLVEFISQEKKKSQPSVAPKSTEDFLPPTLPKRTAPAPTSAAIPKVQPASEAPQAATLATPSAPTARSSEANTAITAPAVPEPKVVKSATHDDLPEEAALPETAAHEPPIASPEAAFDTAPPPERTKTPPKEPTASSKQTLTPRSSGSGGLSLMAALNDLTKEDDSSVDMTESANEEAAPQVQEGPQSVFNEKELIDALSTYIKQRHVKTAIRSLLSAQVPKILDKNTLQISLDNNIQLGYFNEEQKELVPYLRKKLDNFALRFETILVESEQVKKLYLPEEKYKHMAEKNANLIYLRQKIKTDLE